MASPRLAAHQKKARQRGAYLTLIDESGFLLAPLLRRTWAPAGQTPVLAQRARQRDKVSVAAALWLTPARDRLGLSYRMLVNGYFNNERVASWMKALLAELDGPVITVWDGGTMHKGDPIEELVAQCQSRLALERLPPYGSELMPLEQLWGWLKHSRLCNFAPHSARELADVVGGELTAIRDDQRRLRSFFHASALPLPRALLF